MRDAVNFSGDIQVPCTRNFVMNSLAIGFGDKLKLKKCLNILIKNYYNLL